MTGNQTSWKPGQSGNPKGRPPKSRALTEVLARAGKRMLEDVDGMRRARKRIVARVLWDLAATGTAEMPDGQGGSQTIKPLSTDSWFEIIKWLYSHIDGGPKLEVKQEIGGIGGGPLEHRLIGFGNALERIYGGGEDDASA